MKKLALLNSTVLTSNGIFSLKDISLEKARELVKENKSNILNCIGHEPTANTLSKLLGLEIQYIVVLFFLLTYIYFCSKIS